MTSFTFFLRYSHSLTLESIFSAILAFFSLYLSIYRSIYRSIFLSIYLSISRFLVGDVDFCVLPLSIAYIRIINVSSTAHMLGNLEAVRASNDLMLEKSGAYQAWPAYGNYASLETFDYVQHRIDLFPLQLPYRIISFFSSDQFCSDQSYVALFSSAVFCCCEVQYCGSITCIR